MRLALLAALLIFTGSAHAQSPQLFSRDGKYLGNLNKNPYDPNSVANPYGRYGSRFSVDSINNPYGVYGNRYSDDSAHTAYGKGVEIRSHDGRYLGNLNANRYDANSVANPYGRYGSPYAANSINNPYSVYGSPYSSESVWGSGGIESVESYASSDEDAGTYDYVRTYWRPRPGPKQPRLNSDPHPYSYMWGVPTGMEAVAGQ